MTVVGAGLVLLGAVVAVLQVRVAAAAGTGRPIRVWHVSEALPRWQRHGSDVAIAALLLAGAFAIELGRPAWVFYVAIVGAGAFAAAAQAIAVRA
ncbi:hypothetical protein QOZ88_17835 [Blastococcus sp. BMG 814]|uniref:SdpI/YhfL protein family protein n=1 Tax=Blastococcus carthaginiensis TaxID=3050034 RepID=A0ABT9IG12_9ACTN|nr:hypothetical protein [Blastococcus carthaginiensis]MDP5184501.1 hypothetical protein [Blastococcus carthaginiensis]